MDTRSPDQFLWDLITTHAVARCLQIVADFGVPDALEDEPATAVELAARTNLNADALNRIMRLLTTHGIFALKDGQYTHTHISQALRTSHPQSLRSLARMIGTPLVCWNGFNDTIQSGNQVLDWAGLMGYFASNPEEASIFSEAMVGKSGFVIPTIVEAYDFTPYSVIADIGGGLGLLLHAILAQAESATGILFELPHVTAAAAAMAPPRLEVVTGDFFATPLPTADVYILMDVLHDWPNSEAIKILEIIRAAAPAHARVLIIECLVTEAGATFAKMMDVMMLAVTGGRERAPEEYESFLQATGLRLERLIPTASPYFIIEATLA